MTARSRQPTPPLALTVGRSPDHPCQMEQARIPHHSRTSRAERNSLLMRSEAAAQSVAAGIILRSATRSSPSRYLTPPTPDHISSRARIEKYSGLCVPNDAALVTALGAACSRITQAPSSLWFAGEVQDGFRPQRKHITVRRL